mmetsp:Transcript_10072/g.15258  ORF Transcript_10072/g.15258 Transcript_10072/m.15258 type:complete len:420 (-) Transcript_10072:116-1375(-)
MPRGKAFVAKVTQNKTISTSIQTKDLTISNHHITSLQRDQQEQDEQHNDNISVYNPEKTHPLPSETTVESGEADIKAVVIQNFKCLDMFLNYLASRKTSPSISRVQDGVRKMTGRDFTQNDINTIFSLCPDAFIAEWKPSDGRTTDVPGGSYELVISVNKSWPVSLLSSIPSECTSASDKRNMGHLAAESRLLAFQEILSTRNDVSTTNGTSSLLCLPPHPVFLSTPSTTSTPSSPIKDRPGKRRRMNAAARDIIQTAALTQQYEQQSVVPSARASVSLSELKQRVVDRCAASKRRCEHEQQYRPRLAELSLMLSLPRTCDAIRSLALEKNKSIFPLSHVVDILSPSHRAISVLDCIRCLAHTAPEFLTIFPPDDVVPCDNVRVNLNAPYAALRKKLKEKMTEASVEKEKIQNLIRECY